MAAKDGRFYLRLTDAERQLFDEVAEALGMPGASAAVRFVMREKHRELFGAKPPGKRPRKQSR